MEQVLPFVKVSFFNLIPEVEIHLFFLFLLDFKDLKLSILVIYTRIFVKTPTLRQPLHTFYSFCTLSHKAVSTFPDVLRS